MGDVLEAGEMQMTKYRVTRTNSDQELYHHGVKGMRWGVRRSERTSATSTTNKSDDDKHLTDKQKKAIIIGATAVAASLAVIGGMYVYKQHNKPLGTMEMSFGKILDLDQMSTTDTVLKPGSRLQRISSKSVEDYAEEGKRIYVSHLKKDNRMYTDTMPGYIKMWTRKGMVEGDGSAYKHLLKAKNEIKIPSERKLAEIYMQTTKSPHVDDGQFKRFMTNLVNTENPEVQQFFKNIAKEGYNAIVDGNDAGNIAKMPLILLNPKDDIITKGRHKITKIERVISVALM